MNDLEKWGKTELIAILDEADKYLSPNSASLVVGSYDILQAVSELEQEQGDAFLELSLKTGRHAAELGLQGEYIAAALLYYPYLLAYVTDEELQTRFGESTVKILGAQRRLGRFFENCLPWYAQENLAGEETGSEARRKTIWAEQTSERVLTAFLSMAMTPEAAILKCLDRLYLLKTLEHFSLGAETKHALAEDTLSIHAMVMEALGVWSVKWQLEDLAFKVLQPEAYFKIIADLHEHRQNRQARMDRAIATITGKLKAEGIQARVTGRVKHLYGLYTKMLETGKSVQEINDAIGIRIIVNTEAECYQTLDALFRTWPPAEGQYEPGKSYRDWIANPKPNGYQSIHTTVVFEGRLLEVQIRTETMHDLAEYGAAAHWIYRKAGRSVALQGKYQRYVERIAQYRRAYEKAGVE